MLSDVTYGIWSEIPNKQLARPSLPYFMHPWTLRETPQNPPLVGDWSWNIIYFGFECLVAPFVFVYELGA